jgi:CubicO group peptidase (beta-lactamase class C family)
VRRFGFTTFLLVTITFPACRTSTPVEHVAEIEHILAQQRTEQHLPGFAFAIVRDDKVVYVDVQGMRDIEHNLPVTPDTVFPIGSCTKAFTSMAVALAADRGVLSLDDHPRKFLPYFRMADPEADEKVTLRDMLNHRTGLKAYADLAAEPGVLSREDYVRAATSAKPAAKFRSAFQYSNAMYSAIGEIIGKANQSTWERVVQTQIFAPLRMTASTTSAQNATTLANHVTGYVFSAASQTFRAVPPPRSLEALAPGGNVASSVHDMAEWLRMLTDGGSIGGRQFVSPAMFRELTTPLIPINTTTSYALGWATYDWNGLRVVEHNGGSQGISAIVSLIPERHAGFVFLANTSPNFMTRVGNAGKLLWPLILNVVAPVEPVPPKVETPATPAPVISASDPSIEELLPRMIAAIGGETNLRKHSSVEIHARKSYDNQGVVADLTVQERAPSMHNETEAWRAAGKPIGSLRQYFDSVSGGQETTFGQDEINDDEANARARRDNALHPLLDLSQLYKSITVRGASKIGEEPTWLVELTPERGTSTHLQVSQRTSLLMERETGGDTTSFDDYRDVDGERLPFHTTIHDSLGETTIEVISVRFNGIIADAAFRAAR